MKVNNFTESLHGAYIDLRPAILTPIHAKRINFLYDCLECKKTKDNPFQRIMPIQFRKSVCTQAGRSELLCNSPNDIDTKLRSHRWEIFCSAIDKKFDEDDDLEIILCNLLLSLGFVKDVLERIPEYTPFEYKNNSKRSKLKLLKATCRYMLNMANNNDESIDEFVEIADNAPLGSKTKINASLHIIVQLAHSKNHKNLLPHWCNKSKNILKEMNVDEFENNLLLSRYYRAAAFMPYLNNNLKELNCYLDLAEEYANAIPTETSSRELSRIENFHPLYETRSKEFIYCGDKEKAFEYLEKLTRIDPYDARVWLEFGEICVKMNQFEAALNAYLKAILYGPPATAIAYFMAGQCAEMLGNNFLAKYCYVRSLELDPLGVTSSEKLLTHSQDESEVVFNFWVKEHLNMT